MVSWKNAEGHPGSRTAFLFGGNRMKNPFSGLFRARDKPQDSVSAAPVFYFGTSGSGKSVTVQSAIQLSTVYACVRVISETIASLPLGIYETVNDGNEKATDHPLYRLLHDEPNSEMTSFVFREVMLAHLLLYGNSYSQIIRSGKNQVIGLYPLLPDHMDVDRDSKGNLTYWNILKNRIMQLLMALLVLVRQLWQLKKREGMLIKEKKYFSFVIIPN
jgi:phage portal protein BeeE